MTVFDVVAVIGFSAAIVLAATVRPPRTSAGRPALGMFSLATVLLLVVSVSNALEHSGVTSAFDSYEDYLEILFPPLVAYGVYLTYVSSKIEQTRRSARALEAQHGMLVSIVDATPVGIAVLDDLGRVTFANERAKDTLELTEDAETGDYCNPGWVAHDLEEGPGAARIDTLLPRGGRVPGVARGRHRPSRGLADPRCGRRARRLRVRRERPNTTRWGIHLPMRRRARPCAVAPEEGGAGMLKEFKEFALKGNAIDLAVGLVIGAAFGAIVTSLVNDLIMPPVGLLLGGADFQNLFVVLKEGAQVPGPYGSLAAAQAAEAVTLNYGVFLNTLVSFVIITFSIFLVVKLMNSLRKSEEEATAKECPFCRTEIPVEASRCPACTSELGAA